MIQLLSFSSAQHKSFNSPLQLFLSRRHTPVTLGREQMSEPCVTSLRRCVRGTEAGARSAPTADRRTRRSVRDWRRDPDLQPRQHYLTAERVDYCDRTAVTAETLEHLQSRDPRGGSRGGGEALMAQEEQAPYGFSAFLTKSACRGAARRP